MHPAYSVIFFTTASGAGCGLLALLSLLALLRVLPVEQSLGLTGFGLALGLLTFGLLASTFHLGRPERAWRAYSQWRTSWLSREGVIATATYGPAIIFAAGWVIYARVDGPWAVAGWITVLCAAGTVYCTGMIYASLKTIPQWRHPFVPLVYLLMALASGALCLNFLLALLGPASNSVDAIAIIALIAAFAVKAAYWRIIDRAPKTLTPGDATGLGRFGTVRPLEPAHSRPNFVMREMGYAVGRKHAHRLRAIALLSGLALPLAATALAFAAPAALKIVWTGFALVFVAAGLLIERWLFFAEAQHVVTLYYGAQEA